MKNSLFINRESYIKLLKPESLHNLIKSNIILIIEWFSNKTDVRPNNDTLHQTEHS